MKHYIEQVKWFNSRGEPNEPSFRVYSKKSFMGLFSYKKYAKEPDYDTMSSIHFNTIEEAESFIKNILCKGITRSDAELFTIKEITCIP
jgi:hypothetical protein